MKKEMILTAAMMMGGLAFGQQRGDFGAGIILGNPIGPSVNYWLSETNSINAGLGFSNDFAAYVDYQWHSWTILPQPDAGKLNGYVALGGRIEDEDEDAPDDDLDFGIRTMAGMGYFFPDHPIELFLELGPVFELTDDHDVDVDGGVGIRFYF